MAPVSHEKVLSSVVDQNFTKVNPSGCPPQNTGSTPPPSPGDGSDKNPNVDSGISPVVPPPQQEVILSKTPPLAGENPLSEKMVDVGSEGEDGMIGDTPGRGSGRSPTLVPSDPSKEEKRRAKNAAKAAKKFGKQNQKLSSTKRKKDPSEEDDGHSEEEGEVAATPSNRRHVNFTWLNPKKK